MRKKLQEFRREIDSIDDQLVELLKKRASLVKRIFDWKKSSGLPQLDPDRETSILSRVRAQANSDLSRESLERIFRATLKETKPSD